MAEPLDPEQLNTVEAAKAAFVGLVSAGLAKDQAAWDMLHERPGVAWEHIALIGVGAMEGILQTMCAISEDQDPQELWATVCLGLTTPEA